MVGPDEASRLAELGLLAAGLVHEVRQPLSALKAFLDLLDAHPERVKELLPALHGQMRAAEDILKVYGDFSRAPRTPEAFDLGAAVRQGLVIVERKARLAGVRLEVDLPDLPAARGAALAVHQAVINLGNNAVEALVGREGALLSVGAVERDGRLVIWIRDNGDGLPEVVRAHLFEPFRTTKAAGTGLGIRISRDVVHEGGGALRLLDGPGTVWEIELPRV